MGLLLYIFNFPFFLTRSLYFLESISFFLKTTEFIFIFGLVASILNYNFLFSFVLFWVLFYFLQLQNHIMYHVDSIPTFLLAIPFWEPLCIPAAIWTGHSQVCRAMNWAAVMLSWIHVFLFLGLLILLEFHVNVVLRKRFIRYKFPVTVVLKIYLFCSDTCLTG